MSDEGPAEGMTAAEAMLREAIYVIHQRRSKYGRPLEHWRRTVGMINAAYGGLLSRPLTEADWGVIMLFDKIARFLGPEKTSDGPVDIAGYASCIAEVVKEIESEPRPIPVR